MILYFIISESVVLIEKTKNYSLVAIHNKNILLLNKDWLEFNSTMMEKPRQISVTILMLIKFLKFCSANLEFWR